ncbi:glycoside hydrolase family 31 protein [Rubrivirga sp.]|uniref:glycoside hydrolase family 31 protein n=1 Tax=Rubrivirga sp. TaxID=1885344 RepID=UPI003C71EBC5
MQAPTAALEVAHGRIDLDLEVGQLRLDVLSDAVVRVRFAPAGVDMPTFQSYALDPKTEWHGPTTWRVNDEDQAIVFETAALRVRLEAVDGSMTVSDLASAAVLLDTDGMWTTGTGHTVNLHPDDRLLGLGDKALSLDRRGHRLEMWNTDAFKYKRGTDPLYKSVPFVLKQRADAHVGLFYDNTWRTSFDIGVADASRMFYHAESGALDLYVIAAPTPIEVVEAFSEITGKTPMLPKWALGYHQCRYSYMNEGEIREVAAGFRDRNIPCDALYFDIHYMRGYRVFTWDHHRFPDPAGLMSDLEDDGFRSVVIVDPGVKADDPEYDVYNDGLERDAYVRYPDGAEVRGEVWPGECAFPDFTSPAVRDWWGGLHRQLLEDGVDGIWNDMNEPALFSVAHVEGSMGAEEAVGTIPDEARHDLEGRGGTHGEAHNVYGQQMQRSTHEGLLQLAPERRPFTITRAAYAGAQRFGVGWTGDNSATWDHLKLAVETCLSLGTSGMPFVGADVGGFVGQPTGELLARWTQVGALTPLFRNHSAVDTPRQEPWLFGDEVEEVCRKAIELRYRLLPVFYTALWRAATHGTPMLRALPLVHPDDSTIRHTDPLGFYVGADLLAHPVVAQGQTQREIYLPDNDGGWFDFVSGEHYQGRQTIWTQTPLGRIPLYARAGSVVPLAPVRQHTGEPVDRLELHVYPSSRGTSQLYDDAGDGHGDSWTARFDLEDDGNDLTVQTVLEGDYTPEWSGWDIVVHGLEDAPSGVTADGLEVEARWDGRVARFAAPVGASLSVRR